MKKPKFKTKRLGDTEYTESSGNVFADLGLANPEETLAKASFQAERAGRLSLS